MTYKPLEIDRSAINRPSSTAPSDWEPPRHVYFGPRDHTTGKMKKEPKPSGSFYPRALYARDGDGLKETEVQTPEEEAALGSDWKHSPADFGFVTHPTREQIKEMNAEPRRGRPPKEAA